MRTHAGMGGIVIYVFYFSGRGHSRAAAEFLAAELGCTARDIADPKDAGKDICGNACGAGGNAAFVVFPVYCQNIPAPVKAFFRGLKAEYVLPVATYGGISHGNVLREAEKLFSGRAAGGAYLPAEHSFLQGKTPDFSFDAAALLPLTERAKRPQPLSVLSFPRAAKNPLSDLFPALRSRMGAAIERSDACDGCNLCGRLCPVRAMERGVPKRGCIRCLKCVSACPKNALSVRLRFPLKQYLMRSRAGKAEIFL